ncbi:MAG: Tetratricopeptide 2 repeat protein [Bryobacterales bacterium]|nr:Tetratricopeptide 2 repeat protein [Bryobacterales bacterium]
MKLQSALFAASVLSVGFFLAQRGGLFRATPVAAQTSSQVSQQVTQCETLRKHGDPGTKACYQGLSRSNDVAIKAEGLWGLRDYQGANNAFQAAVKARPKDANLKVRWGQMFIEYSQPGDAAALFKEALDIDGNNAKALYGMALVASDAYEGNAADFAEKALKADPKLVEARELLARIALEDNHPEKAVEEAKKALDMSSEALDALSILATVDWLDDKPGKEWIDRVFKINPTYAEAYATAGHFFVINRRYDEGIQYYRKSLELKPDLWAARAELGVNLMRFGQNQEARQHLEQCFNANYSSPLVRNTLKLLDSIDKNVETFTTPTTILKLDKKEATLLRPYFQAELDRAMATYEKKYKFKITGPVQLEVYPNHPDFEVRTMGLPGLGALGVTFGKVVAMDSPSGRPPGSFHWASTLWHEFSHVYVLTMTNHRVPRWFTEGLAVYEETASSPDWGDRLDPPSIMAMKDKKLLPIADLDRGFIHPTYPQQVIVSYFQGGQVITFITEKWGSDKVLAMIHAFADRKDTVEAIEQELKLKPEEFDAQFFPWLEAKYKKQVEGFQSWQEQLKLLSQAAKEKQWDDVIKRGNAIRDLYPDFVETGNVYEFLATAYLAKEDKAKAMAELEQYAIIGGRSPGALKQLADLESDSGKKREAAATLERLNLIYLEDEAAHQKLGKLYMDLKNPNGAIREYQAQLAGGTIDQAGAQFGLAQAFEAANRPEEALDAVYNALEAAPGFKPAQALLRELNAKQSNTKPSGNVKQ